MKNTSIFLSINLIAVFLASAASCAFPQPLYRRICLFVLWFRFRAYPQKRDGHGMFNRFQLAIVGCNNRSGITSSGSKQKGIGKGHFMNSFNTAGFKGNIPGNGFNNSYGRCLNVGKEGIGECGLFLFKPIVNTEYCPRSFCSRSSISYSRSFSSCDDSRKRSTSCPSLSYNPHNASMASAANSFLDFGAAAVHSSRNVAVPAGTDCGRSTIK